MEDDQKIIARVQAGETDEFGKLMEKYGKAIYSLAFQMTAHRDDAEDVYQETFQRAFKYLGGYNDDYSFYTWLHKIAIHEVFKLRKKKYQIGKMEVGLDMESLDHLAGYFSDEETLIEYGELHRELLASLQKLSPNKKSVFVLRIFHGLSLKEIADILDLTVDNVKILLYRARQALSKDLQGFLKHEGR